MAVFGAKWHVLRSVSMVLLNFLLAFVFVSAERGMKLGSSRIDEKEDSESNFMLTAANFLWQSDKSGYQHVWPDMKFGWKIVVGSIVGFFGASFGSVGGVGGGGIFVPMLSLIIGFDPKSATAISKCMIMGAAVSTVYYNLKLRHPTIDMPIIDYDLALLIQPMLMLGISIGVAFNVLFADWMVTVLLIILFFGTSTKAFIKGVETWKKETIMKKEAAKRMESNGASSAEVEYKPLPGGPQKEVAEEREVGVFENVCWKELGLLVFVWVAFLGLQIAKTNTATCSIPYWVLNLLQVPISLGVSGYEAVSLYKGRRVIASKGEYGSHLRVGQLFVYCLFGVIAGVVGGLLGLGGGFIMGPLFLELGIPPQVSSATATFGMTFSSSMSVVEYYLLKRFPVPYALYFVTVATVAAIIGQHAVRRLIILFGRASRGGGVGPEVGLAIIVKLYQPYIQMWSISLDSAEPHQLLKFSIHLKKELGHDSVHVYSFFKTQTGGNEIGDGVDGVGEMGFEPVRAMTGEPVADRYLEGTDGFGWMVDRYWEGTGVIWRRWADSCKHTELRGLGLLKLQYVPRVLVYEVLRSGAAYIYRWINRGSWFLTVCSKITGFLHPIHEVEAVALNEVNWFESIGLRGCHGCRWNSFCSEITGFLHPHLKVEAGALHDDKRVELNNFGGISREREGVLSITGRYSLQNQMAHELLILIITDSSWVFGEGSVSPSVISAVRFYAGLVAV